MKTLASKVTPSPSLYDFSQRSCNSSETENFSGKISWLSNSAYVILLCNTNETIRLQIFAEIHSFINISKEIEPKQEFITPIVFLIFYICLHITCIFPHLNLP